MEIIEINLAIEEAKYMDEEKMRKAEEAKNNSRRGK